MNNKKPGTEEAEKKSFQISFANFQFSFTR